MRSSSRGSPLPHGHGSRRGSRGDQEREQEREQARAQPRRAPPQAHQVRAGCDEGGVQLCPLRAASHGATRVDSEVHQEKGGDTSHQEEERGAEQCLCSHEDGSSQGLSPNPCACNKAFRKKNKKLGRVYSVKEPTLFEDISQILPKLFMVYLKPIYFDSVLTANK